MGRRVKRSEKRWKRFYRTTLLVLAAAALAGGLLFGGWWAVRKLYPGKQEQSSPEQAETELLPQQPEKPDEPEQQPEQQPEEQIEQQTEAVSALAAGMEQAAVIGDEIYSANAIIIDADENIVIAQKNCEQPVYPASMTKVMTILTAAQHISDWNETVIMNGSAINAFRKQGATIMGYYNGEESRLVDLLYGAALRSAADASWQLADYVSGGEAAFAEEMNDRMREMGLSPQANFTNSTGLFDEAHVCTVRDMAAIMRIAMQDAVCAQALSTVRYTTEPTPHAPEGISLRNKYLDWFQQKQPEGFTVTACKNGYIRQAKNCLVSYGENAEGRHYICCTAGAATAAREMKDHRLLYQTYAK